ncbi:MAG: hypothetical protein LBD12_03350, partial [Clostridiales Family XIII bacterium]|nr:hypothetical protein [Clostridiales Family XIII bacterium]
MNTTRNNGLDRALLARLDLVDYTWNDLHLDGSTLTREGVAKLLEGQLVPHVSMAEHEELDCHRRALKIMEDMLHMQTDLDGVGLLRLAGAWDGMNQVRPRRDSPQELPHLGHLPPPSDDIPRLLSELFRRAARTGQEDVTSPDLRVEMLRIA